MEVKKNVITLNYKSLFKPKFKKFDLNTKYRRPKHHHTV